MENRKINILGTEWKIHIVKEFPEHLKEHEETATGLCNGFDKDIFVKDMSDCDCKNKEQLIKNVLRHEVLHAFLFESGLSENAGFSGCWATNEEMVDWFAIQSPKIFKVYSELGIIDTPIPSIPPLQTGALTPRSMIWGDNGIEYLGENAKGATEALKNISDGIRKAAESAKRAGY